MGEKKFYICKHCGNMIGMIKSSGVNVVCCGDPRTELKPNTVEASQEKHLPVAEWLATGQVAVKVGEAAHPMAPEHWIRWIWAVADGQVQRVELEPEQSPEAVFNVKGAGEVALYAYCNLHGLWKTLLQR